MKRLVENRYLMSQLAHYLTNNYSASEIHSWFQQVGADPSWFEFHNTGRSATHKTAYSWCKSLSANGGDEADEILKKLLELLRFDSPNGSQKFQKYLDHLNSISSAKEVQLDLSDIEQVLKIVLGGLSRSLAIIRARHNISSINPFDSDYDLYTLILGLLAPWFREIRIEAYSVNQIKYSSILLPRYKIAIVSQIVSNRIDAIQIVQSTLEHIKYFDTNQICTTLWIIFYDSIDSIEHPQRIANEIENSSEKLIINCLIVES